MTYEPTEGDFAWARMVLRMIKDDGIWSAPMAGSIYRISHTEKKITLLQTADSDDVSKIHERSKVVFGALGYEVN